MHRDRLVSQKAKNIFTSAVLSRQYLHVGLLNTIEFVVGQCFRPKPHTLGKHGQVGMFAYRQLLKSKVQSCCSEFSAGESILQAANAYGHLGSSLATTLGESGFLDLIDIAPIQVEHARSKLSQFKQVQVRQADAAQPGRKGTFLLAYPGTRRQNL